MKSARVMFEKLSRLGSFNKHGNVWNSVGRGGLSWNWERMGEIREGAFSPHLRFLQPESLLRF
jgi:hypothetical protein